MSSREMPRYISHKTVWALKISAVEIHEDGSATIAPADEGYAPLKADVGWAERFKPVRRLHGEDDLGYYVVYQDGYTSWSPTKAFEEGYEAVKS